MVLEVALINVTPGREADFTAAYAKARETLTTTPGCRTVRMTQGLESPSRFVLLVEWDSIEDHEQNFRATERFTTWRGLLGPHFATPPVVEHFTDLDT
jgi:heme-degrading monooxygenase HmoA